MTRPRLPQDWWREITASERFNGAEWLMLAVSALAIAGTAVALARVLQ